MWLMTPLEPGEAPGSSTHDPELSRFLERVIELSALRQTSGPDAFLSVLDQLGAQFRELRKYRKDGALGPSLQAFAARRFELVDEASEYALAADEVLVLSMVLADAATLIVPSLQRSVMILSGVLAEAGVPRLFGQLLKRLRELSRQTGDAELKAWLASVVKALPSD
jgi:hypothetical protein